MMLSGVTKHKIIGNIKSIKFFLFVLFLTTQFNLNACDCDNPPKTFITSIKEFTAELEVVKIDTIRAFNAPSFSLIVLSKLKVIRTFRGSKKIDYIWMDNSMGMDCQRGLFPERLGQKFIITGRLFEDKRYQKWHKNERRTFLYVTTCGKAVLDVEENNVYGIITKNNAQKIKEKYDRLMKEDPAKAKAYYKEIYKTKHHKELVQKMSIDQFYKLME